MAYPSDLTDKPTTAPANTQRRVVVEILGIRGLVRTRLARAISDAAWGEIERQLDDELAPASSCERPAGGVGRRP